MTCSEYDKLKEEITVSVGKSANHNHLLSLLKEIFRNEINSPRKLEEIKSITGLFKILEDRDSLHEHNVLPFKKIVNNLPNKESLLKSINNYEISCVPADPSINYYANRNVANTTNIESNNSCIAINPYTSTTMSERKKDRIFNTIIDQIGTFWRDLARNLRLQESTIDDIEMEKSTLRSKASKVLDKYESRADPQRWFIVLCKALEDSRRKELSEELKEIMVMNI